ncbi:MAG TPA: SPOR domain-containing protein, partial [Caulobacteraceae bacterium]|nr:SPOR domain-containing protein [Caulobacteraceae bacterium]
MTDHDRGAYAPPNDAPLAFDPRRAGARRGPPPVTMVLSLMVLAALLVGGFLLYRHGARAPGEAPQVVGAPVGDFKGAPPTSGAAPADSSASLQIYTTDAPPSSEQPKFVAGPEQPQPRPLAAPPPPAPVAAQPLRPAEPAPRLVQPAAARAAAAPPAQPLVVAKLTPPPAPQAPPVKAPPPAPAAGAAMVQIGALSSQALADKALGEVAKKMPGQMGGTGRKVETTEKDGKTFY